LTSRAGGARFRAVMAHYLDPKGDIPFRKVFGKHKDLCISLLNALLPVEAGRHVADIEFRANDVFSVFDGGKNTIADIYCVDDQGRKFLVEMQMFWTDEFKRRVLFNASKAYISELAEGDKFDRLKPVYSLNLLAESFEKTPEMADEYYHYYRHVNIRHPDRQIEGLELVFVELPKFKPANRAETKLRDLWLRYLTAIKEGAEEVPPDLLADPRTSLAVKLLEQSAYSREELLAKDRFWDWVSCQRTLITGSFREGMSTGMAQGLAQGRLEGERRQQFEIARQMKRENFPADAIARITKLSAEEIARL
jgi:predicted transposase/invertase (TIGR01784 family)